MTVGLLPRRDTKEDEKHIMASKLQAVGADFGEPAWYLSRWKYNITIRAETVQEILQGEEFSCVLDLACGDGSISIPLLKPTNRLTLLDLSSAMLANAKSRISEDLAGNVRLINEDFLKADLAPHSFDLIICLGLIAHVDSPKALVGRIAELLSPEGVVIMESTDSSHFLNWPAIFHHDVLKAVGRMKYTLTLTTRDQVIEMFAAKGLELSAIYRYSMPNFVPGLDRFVSQKNLYNLIRVVYGSIRHNRNAWLGKECIYLFRPKRKATREKAEPEALSVGK